MKSSSNDEASLSKQRNMGIYKTFVIEFHQICSGENQEIDIDNNALNGHIRERTFRVI